MRKLTERRGGKVSTYKYGQYRKNAVNLEKLSQIHFPGGYILYKNIFI